MEAIEYAKNALTWARTYSVFCDSTLPYLQLKLCSADDVLDFSLTLDTSFGGIFHSTLGYYQLRTFMVYIQRGDVLSFLEECLEYRKISDASLRLQWVNKLTRRYKHVEVSNGEQQSFPHNFPPLIPGLGVVQDSLPEGASFELKSLRRSLLGSTTDKSASLATSLRDARIVSSASNASQASLSRATLLRRTSEIRSETSHTYKPSIPFLLLDAFRNAHLKERSLKEVWSSVDVLLKKGPLPRELFDEFIVLLLMDLERVYFPGFLASSCFTGMVQLQHYVSTQPTVSHNDFQWLGRIGRGGYGSVYCCRHKMSGKLYAVKCMDKRLIKTRKALRLVMMEKAVLVGVSHPFITGLEFVFQNDKEICFALEFLPGGDLELHLVRNGRFNNDLVRFYAAEILLALKHLHECGVLHRDIKPANILLGADGHVAVSDLGLSCTLSKRSTQPFLPSISSSPSTPSRRSPRTYIRGKAGTPGFWAPEMLVKDEEGKSGKYGFPADWWSFGCLIYSLIAGRGPFSIKGGDTNDDNHATLNHAPIYPSDLFSTEAKSLLAGLLEKDPRKRLGCGPRGVQEIMEHPYFHGVEWSLLEMKTVSPPWLPPTDIIRLQQGIHPKDKLRLEKLQEITLLPDEQREFSTLNVVPIQSIEKQVIENLTLHALIKADGSAGVRQSLGYPLSHSSGNGSPRAARLANSLANIARDTIPHGRTPPGTGSNILWKLPSPSSNGAPSIDAVGGEELDGHNESLLKELFRDDSGHGPELAQLSPEPPLPRGTRPTLTAAAVARIEENAIEVGLLSSPSQQSSSPYKKKGKSCVIA